MFKILKWTLIGVVGVGATSYFLFGDHAWNYVSTMCSSVKESVRGRIPVEFELKRAEKLIQAIGPEIHQCKRDLARAEVQLEHLVDEVARLERDTARAEKKLKAGAALADGDGDGRFELAGYSYSRQRLEMDLERTFEKYKTNKSLLRSKRTLIERQSKAVAAARAKLDAVRAEEARLRDTIGSLKAQKNQLDAMAASSRNFSLDASALSKAKEVLAEVEERLDVAQKMLEDDLFFEQGIGTGTTKDRDIVKEISRYFSEAGEGGEFVEMNVEESAIPR